MGSDDFIDRRMYDCSLNDALCEVPAQCRLRTYDAGLRRTTPPWLAAAGRSASVCAFLSLLEVARVLRASDLSHALSARVEMTEFVVLASELVTEMCLRRGMCQCTLWSLS